MTEDRDSDAFAARWRAVLEAEIADLARAREATRDDRAPVALDQQSVGRLARMDAMQMQAMAAASQVRRAQREQRLREALGRLDAGEFGWCAECGEPIPEGRLKIDPTLARCVTCAAG